MIALFTTLVLLSLITAPLVLILLSQSRPRRSKSVAILVLGDIGRSPRMLYHSQSFVDHQFKTVIIAYKGSTPPKSLTSSPLVEFIYLETPLGFVSNLPKPLFVLFSPFKVIFGALSLFHLLVWKIDFIPEFVLVQNPPSIPTLPIVQLTRLLMRMNFKLIIDWHNTGHSILSLRLGSQSRLVKLAKSIESFFGKTAYAHLCVSKAMLNQLRSEFQLKGQSVIFHDRPPVQFRRATTQESHNLFSTSLSSLLSPLEPFYNNSKNDISHDKKLINDITSSTSSSLFTFRDNEGTTKFLESDSRPRLLVSATSWTEDEDFDILLNALDLYDRIASDHRVGNRLKEDGFEGRLKRGVKDGLGDHSGVQEEMKRRRTKGEELPQLLVLITGKGKGKTMFENRVNEFEKRWEFVRVRTVWLKIQDYPLLLGSADLGISLHSSSSGIDLPMKVVDMFGAKLPVLALNFKCIDELVKDGKNGRVFDDAQGLNNLLMELLKDPKGQEIERLRKGIDQIDYGDGERWCGWEENWDRVLGPIIDLPNKES